MGNVIKIGFIGIGQCGSNIAEIAELYGYRTAICNTSPEDLDSITLIKNKVLLGSNGGAGKDRRMAKQDAKENYEKIVNLIKEKFNGINMIYFVFSAGGGTGSGMSPMMLDVVRRLVPEKNFGCVTVLPDKRESIVSQMNALECLKEIIRLELPCFIADNQKLIDKTIRSRKDLFDKMNNYIIDCFNLIFNTNRKPSKYGNLDQQDIVRLLSTPGATIITTTGIGKQEKTEKGFSFGKKLMKSWDNSYFAEIEYGKKLPTFGFIYELEESTTKLVEYSEIEKELGKSLETFEGYYEPNDGNELITSILAGLSYPIERINEISELIKNGRQEEKEEDYNDLFNVDTTWLNKNRDKSKFKTIQDDEEEDDNEDIEEFEEDEEESKPIKKKKSSSNTPKKKKESSFNIEDIFAKYE